MSRLTLCFILFLVLSSCSSLKNKNIRSQEVAYNSNIFDVNNILANRTDRNIDIQKINIQVINKENSEEITANFKYRYPDKYLISLRTKIGMEVMRIYISNDTIRMVDRINEVMYLGTNNDIKSKFGYNIDVLPLLMGNWIGEKDMNGIQMVCDSGSILIEEQSGSTSLKYNIDCLSGKPTEVVVNERNGSITNVRYLEYQIVDNIIFPGNIELWFNNEGIRVLLTYSNIDLNPEREISFNIDKNMEVIKLVDINYE